MNDRYRVDLVRKQSKLADTMHETWFILTCLRCHNTLKVRRYGIAKAWLRVHGFICRGQIFPMLRPPALKDD